MGISYVLLTAKNIQTKSLEWKEGNSSNKRLWQARLYGQRNIVLGKA